MRSKKKILLIVLTIFMFFVCLFIPNAKAAEGNNNEYLYLSDIDYIESQSKAGWGAILKDQANGGSKLSVKVEGAYYTYDKGMWAHATSTLVYDISAYKDEYDYFTTYMGLNKTAASSSNGVKFYVYTSVDGKTWNLATEENPEVSKPGANARYVEINIKDVNYLKLYADSNGANGNDHSVYADAKFVTQEYLEEQNSLVLDIDTYDQKIKDYPNKDISDPNYELLLLQRDLASNLGEYALKRFITESEDNKATIDWLMNDVENLRYYILGGVPTGGYFSSLTQLTRLLKEYKSDFDITEPISDEGIKRLHNRRPDAPTTKGDLYKRMVITLSLTHSARVALWMQPSAPENQSDAVVRYKIYKDMYNKGMFKATDAANITPWFESYTIEEMRYVMNTLLDDESIIWLNEYTQAKIDKTPNNAWGLLTPHSYIAYVWPNYGNPIYYSEENRDYFNQLFSVNGKTLDDYGISRGTLDYRLNKLWMNFRNKFGTGCVCGGISKSGHCIRGVHGIASAVIGQPGHAALLYYTQDSNGKGYWGIDNDVSGWTLSEKGERMPLGWGNASYSRGYSVVYIALAQEAMNDQANLEKCQKIMIQAKVYAGDPAKQEEIYREALKVQPINIDAWYGLYNTYLANPEKTEDDFYYLAEEMAESLKYFPLPMYHLTNLIKPRMVSVENSYRFTLLQTRILNEGKVVPNNTADSYTVYQPSLTRLMANYILGTLDTSIASFSFDGEDANKIVLASRFDGNGVRWDYCIDGNPTGGLEHWNEVAFDGSEEHKWLLTPEEIASITAENDIYIHIVGVDYSEKNLYKIDIKESAGIPSTLYANDWENKLIAATPVIMWKLNENDPWTLYSEAEPDLSGDKTVTVKVAATGTYLESKTEQTYTFTTNTDPDTRKYISIDHIGLHSFSTQADSQNRYAKYAIDGNLNTSWHSNWNGNDPDKFIVFEFDEPKNLTALEYFPAPGGNGKILSAQILVSIDGEEWTEVVSGTDWNYANTNDVTTKVVEFDPVKAKYVKIVGKRTQNSFITARMFNLYENTTVRIVGTFSFDGDNAKKIIVDNDFKGQSWQYSLDGGATWKNGSGDEHLLTDAEIEQITSENQIKMKFAGNETQYTIKINKIDTPTITSYLNDWENTLIGVTNKNILEWRIEGTNTWTDYSVEDPIVEGAKKLYVRAKATSNFTASDILEYQFAEDTDTAKEKYIPISHLSVNAYSSQSIDSTRPFYAVNAIDGNRNTLWHTDFRYSIEGKRAFITIKLDENKYISALEYVQKKYRVDDPAYIKNAYIYVSENGEDWIEAGRLENALQDEEFKKITFNESVSGQYVKIEIEGYGIFASLAMVNLYEDTTVKKVGEFSFDGEEANKIILTDEFKGLNWEYSIDGGNTWKRGTSDTHMLTADEVEQVNGDNKIKLKINNVEYVINIQKSSTPIITAYLNDLENRLIGISNTETLEWKIESNRRNASGWTDYSEQEPIVEGDAKLLVRQKARNVFAASEAVEFNFTDDNQADTRKYVPVSHLEIAGFSAEDKAQNGAAANAIDGNYNTRWLNSAAGTDNEKYIIIKLDTAIYLSAMDYVPHSENGKILSGKIEGSMDGENFTEIAQISGWANNQNTKTIDFDEPVKVRYVKITGVETSYTGAKRHVGARMFNFYEDTTKKEEVVVTAEIEYSTKELTNQDVVVRLVNASTDITVLNNGGSTEYTFTENGTFTFEFEDREGNKGTATATVDWICKTLPEAILEYDIPNPTNKDVTVTVKFKVNGEFSDKVTILNNNGSNTHTFTENGEFTFNFRGPYGNEGSVTANVDWIIKTLPTATFSYDITETTNRPVTVTVTFDRENVTILNNDGKNTYTFTENGEFTFEFRGPYGNEGVATARVDWIDNTIPTATVSYNITEKTNRDVVATLEKGDQNLTITNNNGKETYTFTENGTFTFEFINELGNRGTAIAKVDWIDKKVPNATISYNIIGATNQSVIATITFDKEGVTVEGGNTHTFTENGEYTFNFVDEAGNTGTETAKVTWIDKTLPISTITYSTTNPTNKNVIATITFDKEGVTVEGGNTHTFTENGVYEFQYVGPAGNTGVAIAEVTWIDKKVPEATVVYSTINPTNKDVTATVVFENEEEGEVTILNNGGRNQYTFTENGTFTFEFSDKAGNKGTAKAIVNYIDRIAPTATVSYNITDKTNKNVVATLENMSEEVTITNNDAKETYTFTKNGTFTFEFIDRAGNKGTATATVNWIDRRLPVGTITYSTTRLTNQDVIATITIDKENVTVEGGNTHTFTKNGEYTFEFVDEAGNIGMKTAVVNWIDKIAPTAKIEYNITEETEGNVTATLVDESEDIIVTNNSGARSYVFTENGEFTFEFVDKAGNNGTAKAIVNWIVNGSDNEDEEYEKLKEQYIAIIEEYMNNVTEEELNNKFMNTEEKIKVIEAYDNLKEADRAKYNDFIDRLQAGGAPIITVINANLEYEEGTEIDLYSLITIKDNEDGNIIPSKDTVDITTDLDITKTGIYNVKYEVTDTDGNSNSITIKITIKKKAEIPGQNSNFSVVLESPKDVLNPGDEIELNAKISNMENVDKGLIVILGQFEYDTEKIEILGFAGENGWNMDKDFFNKNNFKFVTDNGEFIKENGIIFKVRIKIKEEITVPTDIIFKLKSIIGSNGDYDIEAKDTSMQLRVEEMVEEPARISSDKYLIEKDTISRILPETTFTEFKNNVTANREITIIDENGNRIGDNDIIKTNMKLKVGDSLEFSLVVIGDINEDGKITVTDLAQLKFHYVEKIILQGNNLKAGDVNGDGRITLTDIAQLKLIIVDLIQLR